MPETKEQRAAATRTIPRDANGRFVKGGTPLIETTKTEIKTQSPLPTIPPSLPNLPNTPNLPASPAGGPKKTTKEKSDLDAPLVVINNPFRKLLHWLDDIRKKQTTTFDLKVSVPLIALPIFLVVVGGAMQYMFTLGKQTAQNNPTPTPIVTNPTPAPVLISKVGIIKGTYAVLADEVTPTSTPQPTNTPVPSNTPTPTPTLTPTPSPTITPTPIPPSRFVLVDKDEKIFFLITPSTLSLNKYLNQRVLITGLYDSTKETITIKKSSDIEVLP